MKRPMAEAWVNMLVAEAVPVVLVVGMTMPVAHWSRLQAGAMLSQCGGGFVPTPAIGVLEPMRHQQGDCHRQADWLMALWLIGRSYQPTKKIMLAPRARTGTENDSRHILGQKTALQAI